MLRQHVNFDRERKPRLPKYLFYSKYGNKNLNKNTFVLTTTSITKDYFSFTTLQTTNKCLAFDHPYIGKSNMIKTLYLIIIIFIS